MEMLVSFASLNVYTCLSSFCLSSKTIDFSFYCYNATRACRVDSFSRKNTALQKEQLGLQGPVLFLGTRLGAPPY
ncbi:hypothetical protein EDC96DRAFT_498062 [Choanephora cucurbitarum]|nr:hypothetical protein EDC96DRAFT_498062 [Choanephora cucurbitarum]